MKYSEAKKAIEALSSKYSAYKDKDTDFFNVYYKNDEVAYVQPNKQYSVTVWLEKYFSKLPFSNKLYMILAELAMTPLDKRLEDEKYFIHVFKGCDGYLNFYGGKPELNDASDGGEYKVKFTDKEIEQLKKRDDIPLDWNKVTLEEANED